MLPRHVAVGDALISLSPNKLIYREEDTTLWGCFKVTQDNESKLLAISAGLKKAGFFLSQRWGAFKTVDIREPSFWEGAKASPQPGRCELTWGE